VLSTTAAYDVAVIADSRQAKVKALARIVDPDVVFGTPTASPTLLGFNNNMEPPTAVGLRRLIDEDMQSYTREETLEPCRWLLNGKFMPLPIPLRLAEDLAFISTSMCDEDGVFSGILPYAIVPFTGVDTLQACMV